MENEETQRKDALNERIEKLVEDAYYGAKLEESREVAVNALVDAWLARSPDVADWFGACARLRAPEAVRIVGDVLEWPDGWPEEVLFSAIDAASVLCAPDNPWVERVAGALIRHAESLLAGKRYIMASRALLGAFIVNVDPDVRLVLLLRVMVTWPPQHLGLLISHVVEGMKRGKSFFRDDQRAALLIAGLRWEAEMEQGEKTQHVRSWACEFIGRIAVASHLREVVDMLYARLDVADEGILLAGLIGATQGLLALFPASEDQFRQDKKGRRLLKEAQEHMQRRFAILAKQWKVETRLESSLTRKFAHQAYREIIAFGWPVIPLIIAQMQARPNHWFPGAAGDYGRKPRAPG